MIKKHDYLKTVVAIFFVVVLFMEFIKSSSYTMLPQIANYLAQNEDNSEKTIADIESDFTSSIWGKNNFINLNGIMAKKLKMQGFYSNMGMYITDDNYIVSASDYTSTDYEYNEIVSFNEFLEDNNINLLYVNEPTKYTDDSFFEKEFGVNTYSNRNMDKFLSRIREQGINAIDLRENISKNGIRCSDLFYRTDHHWTVPAGLWATKIITEGLNKYCDYDIDTSIYDEKNYTFKKWNECWLGEQGRKVAETYVGLDDFTEVKPDFNTSFTFRKQDGANYNGTFDAFIDESVYNTENNVYKNKSWHYSYNRISCINNKVDYGKVLIVGDSYTHVTHPFLALGIHSVDSLILRNYDDSFSLRDYILSKGYDTVIIAYAQFMVGQHDNPSSANYRMFNFK